MYLLMCVITISSQWEGEREGEGREEGREGGREEGREGGREKVRQNQSSIGGREVKALTEGV